MTTLCSYDLNGQKLSFANWISNLSPQDTPFTSMTGKESIQQTMFQWQTDTLTAAGENSQVEGDEAVESAIRTTKVLSNNTQILRKTVKVSDTANALANYGRGKELQYQMEKAGKEIKRDLEWVFLHNHQARASENPSDAGEKGRRTAGFLGLVAAKNEADLDTGAVVHSNSTATGKLSEADIFGLTYNLYLAGSRADIIMFHPKWASVFSSLQEKGEGGVTRQRIFENTPKFSVHVSTLVDPLGQEYKLIPNRWMPEGVVYFFNSSDWTQMVLRAPNRTKLAKDGSYEKWMLEMEVGLRHRHPFASGIIDVDTSDDLDQKFTSAKFSYTPTTGAGAVEADVKTSSVSAQVKKGGKIEIKVTAPIAGVAPAGSKLYVLKDGVEFGHWTESDMSTEVTKTVTTHASAVSHNGTYMIVIANTAGVKTAMSHPFIVEVV